MATLARSGVDRIGGDVGIRAPSTPGRPLVTMTPMEKPKPSRVPKTPALARRGAAALAVGLGLSGAAACGDLASSPAPNPPQPMPPQPGEEKDASPAVEGASDAAVGTDAAAALDTRAPIDGSAGLDADVGTGLDGSRSVDATDFDRYIILPPPPP